ncbi:MAG: hypothetical protein ACMUIE_10735 [Thermoplasmatota archaeon]
MRIVMVNYSFFEFQKGRFLYEYLRANGWKKDNIKFLSKDNDPYPSQGETTRENVIEAFEWMIEKSGYDNDVLIYISNPTKSYDEDLEEYFEQVQQILKELESPLAVQMSTIINYFERIPFPDIAWLNLSSNNAITQRIYLDELDELLDKTKKDKLYLVGCGIRSGLLMNRLKRHDRAVMTSMTSQQKPDIDQFNIAGGVVESRSENLLLGFFHELNRLEKEGYLKDQYPMIHFDPEFMGITEGEKTKRPPLIILPPTIATYTKQVPLPKDWPPKQADEGERTTGKEPGTSEDDQPSFEMPDFGLLAMDESYEIVNSDEESVTIKYYKSRIQPTVTGKKYTVRRM